jgi:hypothetical protein
VCRALKGANEVSLMSTTNIEVAHESDQTYGVTVHSQRTTRHRVVVTAGDCDRFAPAGVSIERLLEESFRFLLEREPNTSILSAFDLPLIGNYFPEYPSEIFRRLS